jgi:peptide/nickel transport system substrate-binding protein
MFVKIFSKLLQLAVLLLVSILTILPVAPAGAVEIVIAVPDEIQGTDVQQVTWDQVVHQLLFEPLFHLAPDLKSFVPGTASEWKMSNNNRELRFTVPRGRRFSNGEPLTAEAFVASFERYMEISPYADDLTSVESIRSEGDEIIFSFKSSPAPAMVSLSSVYGGAVEAKDAAARGPEESKSIINSYGPLKIDEWVQGSHIRLVPNEHYGTYNPLVTNKEPIKVDAITIRFVPDNFTRVQELQAGDVDVIYNVPGERVASLRNSDGIALHNSLQSGCAMLVFNPDVPGLDDDNVRMAILKSIDRAELVTALSGAAQERYGILSPAMIGYSQEFEDEAKAGYSYDPDAAVKLLEDAGYRRGTDGIMERGGQKLDFTFMVAFDVPTIKQMAPVIQAQLKKVGINVNIREFERQYVNQATRDRTYEIASRHYVWGDADMLTYLFHTESEYYSYPDVDRDIEAGRESPDPEVRAKAYATAQRTIMSKLIAVPLVSEIEYIAYRKSVQGLFLTPTKVLFVNDISKD